MLKYSVALLLLLFLWSCTDNEESQIVYEKSYKDAIIESQEGLRRFMMTSFVPGMSVSVSVDGELVWSQGLGVASKELNVPVTRDTRFRAGHLAHMFTTYMAAYLQQQGKMNIDSSFYHYIPEFPKKKYDFTPRMLGVYSAGFKEHNIEELLKHDSINTYKDFIRFFEDEELVYKPDQQLLRSDYGSSLLALVNEEVTEEHYLKMFRNLFVDSLDLKSLVYARNDAIVPNRSEFYGLDYVARLSNAREVYLLPFMPAHGLLSNADDINKAAQLILEPGFFNEETLTLFRQPHVFNDSIEVRRSFGWWYLIDEEERNLLIQFGETIGGGSAVVVYPEYGLVVSVAANKSSNIKEMPANMIARIFLKHMGNE
ncbi:MAG: serine hydrolase [Prolixibacteraceae bacterium]|jgi:serine beta-lactamase-like protein LACTB|nr:serine hydrolase [Prolixibacteraceae bacterium]